MLHSDNEALAAMGKTMTRAGKATLDSLQKAEKKLKSQQSTQSFDGTVRVNLDRVFVARKDGLRALEGLKKMKVAVGQS